MIGISEKRRLTLEQAARWFLWLRDNKADPREMEVFQRWRQSSGRNRRAYEKVESLWQSCNGVDVNDLPWPTELEIEQDSYDGSYALPLPSSSNPLQGDSLLIGASSAEEFVLGGGRNTPRRWTRNWRAAASFCLVAVLLTLSMPRLMDWATMDSTPYFSTAVAQQRTEVLQDGSVLTMGGATQVSIEFSANKRVVVLEKGEAYFEVSKDSQRPFSVVVGNSEVRAIGTAFNINRRFDEVTVSVIQGTVDVSQKHQSLETEANKVTDSVLNQRLSEGQELVLNREGHIQLTESSATLERALAWREGRLAYVNARLDHVLQDINRYSVQKIVIGDWELGELRYTGTVFSQDIKAWLKGLEQAFELRTLEVDERTVLVRDSTSKRT